MCLLRATRQDVYHSNSKTEAQQMELAPSFRFLIDIVILEHYNYENTSTPDFTNRI